MSTEISELTASINALRETTERLITTMAPRKPAIEPQVMTGGELRVFLEKNLIPYPPEAPRFELVAIANQAIAFANKS